MASQPLEPSRDDRSPARANARLVPFRGHFVPGVHFESGHCFWLVDFSATPTAFDAYTELWMITPAGERVLYTDPGDATEETLKYHDFDRTSGAQIDREQVGPRSLQVTVDADDGTELTLELALSQTPRTHALNTLIALTPTSLARSRFGTVVSTLSMNLLVDANGLQVAGRSETGRRYRLEADRLHAISDASATLDGTRLGDPVPPARPIEFGDARTTGNPLYADGAMFLECVAP